MLWGPERCGDSRRQSISVETLAEDTGQQIGAGDAGFGGNLNLRLLVLRPESGSDAAKPVRVGGAERRFAQDDDGRISDAASLQKKSDVVPDRQRAKRCAILVRTDLGHGRRPLEV